MWRQTAAPLLLEARVRCEVVETQHQPHALQAISDLKPAELAEFEVRAAVRYILSWNCGLLCAFN